MWAILIQTHVEGTKTIKFQEVHKWEIKKIQRKNPSKKILWNISPMPTLHWATLQMSQKARHPPERMQPTTYAAREVHKSDPANQHQNRGDSLHTSGNILPKWTASCWRTQKSHMRHMWREAGNRRPTMQLLLPRNNMWRPLQLSGTDMQRIWTDGANPSRDAQKRWKESKGSATTTRLTSDITGISKQHTDNSNQSSQDRLSVWQTMLHTKRQGEHLGRSRRLWRQTQHG